MRKTTHVCDLEKSEMTARKNCEQRLQTLIANTFSINETSISHKRISKRLNLLTWSSCHRMLIRHLFSNTYQRNTLNKAHNQHHYSTCEESNREINIIIRHVKKAIEKQTKTILKNQEVELSKLRVKFISTWRWLCTKILVRSVRNSKM